VTSIPTGPGAAVEAEAEKHRAAEAAAQLVGSGMTVGLGTGSTVAYLLPALAARELRIVCVATSVPTEQEARRLGLDVLLFDRLDRLDIAIDGADQVARDFWLVKGGGGAHTREKIVAAAADRFVVIVSSDKLVEAVAGPVPLEVLGFGLGATLRELERLGECRLRGSPPTPDGGILIDYFGPVVDPAELSERLDAIPGVVGHGLFPPSLVREVVVGRPAGVDHLVP